MKPNEKSTVRIVVLDGYTMNPGEMSSDPLHALGACTIHDRTAPDDVLARAAEATVLLTNKTVLGRKEIFALPRLRYIGILATGTNVVDLAAAAERGIVVTNVPAYSTPSVAQLVFAFILDHTQRVALHGRLVREGEWCRSPDFSFRAAPLVELAGKTMGIIGLGRIGTAVARLASAFDMRVLAAVRRAEQSVPAWVETCSIDEVFRRADFVSLHCPLTPRTEGLVNAERLILMQPHAFLINTSRGGLVDEQALAEALNQGRIAGAGLDVLTREPPDADCPLLRAANCRITPHIGWATQESRQRLFEVAVDNVRAFLAGHPVNTVSAE